MKINIALEMITTARREGQSFANIANLLNEQNIATGQGGVKWYASSVRAVLRANGGDVLDVMPRAGRKAKAVN